MKQNNDNDNDNNGLNSTSTTTKFTHNILLLGMLAKVYSELDYTSPVHNWGVGVPLRDLDLGGVIYTIGPSRRREPDPVLHGQQLDVLGVSITEKPGHFSGAPGPQRTWFVPCSALASVQYELDGVLQLDPPQPQQQDTADGNNN